MYLPITASYPSLNINMVASRLGHGRGSLWECSIKTQGTQTVQSHGACPLTVYAQLACRYSVRQYLIYINLLKLGSLWVSMNYHICAHIYEYIHLCCTLLAEILIAAALWGRERCQREIHTLPEEFPRCRKHWQITSGVEAKNREAKSVVFFLAPILPLLSFSSLSVTVAAFLHNFPSLETVDLEKKMLPLCGLSFRRFDM